MKNIALIFAFQENSLFARKLVRGITTCREKHGFPWLLHLVEWTTLNPARLTRQKYDGAIGILPPDCNPEGIPCIHIAGQRIDPQYARLCIGQNNDLIIRTAAESLWRSGYRHLALLGYPRAPSMFWQEERIQAFCQICIDFGIDPILLFPNHRIKNSLFLEQSLKGLPFPTGVIAVNDFRAMDILETAEQLALHIPEQIGVVGIDNDEMLCEISVPTLSSIEHFPQKKGHHAALMLNALLSDEAPPPFESSLQLIERTSTRAFHHKDVRLCSALSYIESHIGTPIRTDDVAENAKVSRATLERIFRIELRSTVNREITAARVALAKQKLSETSASLKEIAAQCGFQNVHYFTTIFKKTTGISPGVHRKTIGKNPD
jgi:LacI family transcriptional regulator